MREYTIKVEDGRQDNTVRVTEPFDHPELEQLIAELHLRARAQTASQPAKKP